MGKRHMHRSPFVAHVDDADAEPGHMVPDRLDMAALEPEYPVDAACLQEARNPGGTGVQIGVEVDRAARWVGHGSASLFGHQLCFEDPMQILAGSRAGHLLVADERADPR